jgi:hypothetical protein
VKYAFEQHLSNRLVVARGRRTFTMAEEAQVPFGHQGWQLRARSELTVCGVGAYMQNTPP